jgi:hypothetical protein
MASVTPTSNIATTATASTCKRLLDFFDPVTETDILGK